MSKVNVLGLIKSYNGRIIVYRVLGVTNMTVEKGSSITYFSDDNKLVNTGDTISYHYIDSSSQNSFIIINDTYAII